MSYADSHSHIKLLLRTQAITYLTNHSGIYIEFFTLQSTFTCATSFLFPNTVCEGLRKEWFPYLYVLTPMPVTWVVPHK